MPRTKFTPRKVALTNTEKLRLDATLTAARYDEIVTLRILLMEVADDLEGLDHPSDRSRLRERILKRAEVWGTKGDIV
jgi:hypothetical protein